MKSKRAIRDRNHPLFRGIALSDISNDALNMGSRFILYVLKISCGERYPTPSSMYVYIYRFLQRLIRIIISTTRRVVPDRGGNTSVEFALISGLLFVTILFVLSVALVEVMGQSLDYATQKAARQLMTGAVQKAGLGQSAFLTSVLCPYLPAYLACSNVIINLYTVPYGTGSGGYYSFTTNNSASGLTIPPLSNTTAQFSPGQQGSYQYLIVVYPLTSFPSFLSNTLGMVSYNGAPAYPIVATAAFRNEQY